MQIGDFAVFEAPRFEQNGVLCGPYLDNRIGCVTLLLMMEQLAEAETENDLYFVFTAQGRSVCAAQARRQLRSRAGCGDRR
ncbi:MAG: hypothetical protein ACLR4Z_09070 [Butyricicoccaceae bacterium]